MINYSNSKKLGLLKKVIDGRAPKYLITTLDSVWFEHKYSRTRTEAMRRTFFYPTIKELNAFNLEATTSFSLMKTTLTNYVASNYTVNNFKVKKLFWFYKSVLFLNIIVDWIPFFSNEFTSVFNISQFFKSLEFLKTFYYNHYL